MNPQLPTAKHAFSNEDINALLHKNGLDFTVKKIETTSDVPGHKGEPTGFYTAYRADTGKTFQTGLTKRWHPIQNKDVFKCVADLSKVTDTRLVDIRSFDDGAEIAAQLELGDPQYVDKGGSGGIGVARDKITNFLCVLFSHNGTRALSLYMNGKRWSCNNMINPSFRAAIAANKKTKKALITVQHSENAKAKLKELVKGVTIANNEFHYSMDFYRNLRNTKMDSNLLKDVINEYFTLARKGEPTGNKKTLTQRQKNNLKNEMDDIKRRYRLADNGLQPVDSAWNMYNTIQGHIQHYTTRKDKTPSEASYKSTLIGQNETQAAHMLRTIVEMTIGLSAVNFSKFALTR